MTARNLIFAEIERRLNLIPGIASVERMPSGDPDVFPALEIYDHGHAVLEDGADRTEFALATTIEGYVVGGDGVAAHDAIATLYADVVQAIFAELPLSGAEIVDEGDLRVAVTPLASESRLGFALDLSIQFATPRGDPSRFA